MHDEEQNLRDWLREKWGTILDPNLPPKELTENFNKHQDEIYNDLLTLLAVLKRKEEISKKDDSDNG